MPCCRWCKLLSGGASSSLRRKPELAVEDGLATSPQCTLNTPCRYTERTPIAHVREKVTTWSGQPVYSEFFELRPPNATLPLSAASPLHRCRLASTSDQPSSPADLLRPESRPLHRRVDCVYGQVPGVRGDGFAATMAGRGRCLQHDVGVSPRRAVSTDRLLTGKDLDVGEEMSASHGHGHGLSGTTAAAASPDLLPGSDLESLVNISSQ